jgi:hypothetical protein
VYSIKESYSRAFNEDEFLRKFFNVTLRIPNFYPSELEVYANNNLSATNIEELADPSVAWLIVKAFRDNPRQIKQFINQLVAKYTLIKQRIANSSLPSDFLKGNVPRLARFLILYNKFPDNMQTVIEKKIWDLENLPPEILSDDKSKSFVTFLHETKHIQIKNLDIFLTLRKSESEAQLPGFDQFAAALQDNNIEEVTNYLKALSEFKAKRSNLSLAIRKLLENSRTQDTKISIINSSITALDQLKETLERQFYTDAANELILMRNLINVITPQVLFAQLLRPYAEHRKDFLEIYLDLINSPQPPSNEFQKSVLSEITNYPDWLSEGMIARITQILTDHYHQEAQIIGLFLRSPDLQRIFAVNQILAKTISSLTSFELEFPFTKLALLSDVIPEIFDKSLVNGSLNAFTQLLSHEHQKPPDDIRFEYRQKLLSSIYAVIKNHEQSFASFADPNEKDLFGSTVVESVNKVPTWDQRNIYLCVLLQIEEWNINSSPVANSMIKKSINAFSSQSLVETLEGLGTEQTQYMLFGEKYESVLKQKALKDQFVFDYLYPLLKETQKSAWMLSLIEQDVDRGIHKLKTVEKDIPDKVNILSQLLERSKTLEPAQRYQVFLIADTVDFAQDSELMQVGAQQLTIDATTLDQLNQKIVFDLIDNIHSFSESDKRQIAQKIIDWLHALNDQQIYQSYSAQTVLKVWYVLRDQDYYRERFQEYILRILLKSSNIEAITFCRDAFVIIKPNQSRFPSYYSDLQARIEKEPDETIRTILKEILLSDQ